MRNLKSVTIYDQIMWIYDIRFRIISISLTIVFFSLINFTYGQEVNNTATINNNAIFEENLPPTTVGDRQASLYTKIIPPVSTSDTKQDALFQLRLFDSKAGSNITNVNYYLTITKADKLLLRELFYSKDGPLTLKFQQNQGPVTVHGTTEPFLGGWTSETGQITVSGPILTEAGSYQYSVEIFGVDNVRNIFVPENAPRFDSSFLMDMNGIEQAKPISIMGNNTVALSPSYSNYTSDKYQIQFQYPSDWEFNEKTNRFEEGTDISIRSFDFPGFGLITVGRVNDLTTEFGSNDFISGFYEIYEQAISDYTKEISVIEQPSFINIDGQKAGTFLITQKDKYEENALRTASQIWAVYVGDHGYLISFASTTDQFDSQENVKIRDDFIKSIRFLGSENATNTNITNRFG